MNTARSAPDPGDAVASPGQGDVVNRLLRAISAEDFALLQPHLTAAPAPVSTVFIESGRPIEQVFFPEQGFTSVTSESAAGKIELGMIGREGLVGAGPVLLGDQRSPHEHFVQMPGVVLGLPTDVLLDAVSRSATLRRLLLRYVQAFLIQTAQTAHANAAHGIEARLSRWLLMCHDRADGDDLQITHEFLSMMLGVRRPGVTIAVQILEGNRLIKATRGRIRVLDRQGLERATADSYGVAEAEYARLIAPA